MKIIILVVLCILGTSSLVFNELQPIIQYVNNLQTTWKAGHNSYFDGMTMDEIKSLLGALETPEQLKLQVKNIQPLLGAPDQFSSADNWPKCQSIKEIRDQSACGSCWAFGAVEAFSDRICIASNQQLQVRISSQDLTTCCTSCGMGCNGGYLSAAWSYFRSPGVVTGWLYGDTTRCQPYSLPPCDHHVDGKYDPCGATKPTPRCVSSCIPQYTTPFTQDRWTCSSVYGVPSNVASIQNEILTHGPVQAAFSVYQDFLTYKSGVYHHTSGSMLGGHAVKVVGWGVENGTPYWQVANSWNEDWGDKGFFKIRRGFNQCGIQSQIYAGIPVIKTQTVTQ